MSAADSRIPDGVIIPVRPIDCLQPQSSAFRVEGRLGRRYSVKVDVFRLSVSVLTAHGTTRHFAFPVLWRFQSFSQGPTNLFPLFSAAATLRAQLRATSIRKPTKKKCCIRGSQEKRLKSVIAQMDKRHKQSKRYDHLLISTSNS